MQNQSQKILNILKDIYGEQAFDIKKNIDELVCKYQKNNRKNEQKWLTENDSILITYADSINSNNNEDIKALENTLKKYVDGSISAVHLLPFYPFSSDDGFSVINYREVRKEAGSWNDIVSLSKSYELMFDAVINHISSKSEWFSGYLNGVEKYKNFFIKSDDLFDYSNVTRPRDLPLLTEFQTSQGIKKVWTTFSADQIDLNFKESKVLLEVLDILLMYVEKGARYLRLDAIGFLWKENATTCMHLKQTHQIIKLIRLVLESCDDEVIIITETNTPHEENISYFGKDYDEAHMVYQFPLPPLTLYTFLKKDSTVILDWIDKLGNIDAKASYFNFLASHDGIGLRPLEGILDDKEIAEIEKKVLERKGQISYRSLPDGSSKAYELNINYMDAICEPELGDDARVKKFIASQAILLSVVGVPGIYIHSLFGSRNDVEGVERSGIKRRINREKLDIKSLHEELDNTNSLRSKVLKEFLHLINVRKKQSAFSPQAKQRPVYIDKRVFCIERENNSTNELVRVMINISDEPCEVEGGGINIITQEQIPEKYIIKPYEVMWLLKVLGNK